MNDIVKWISKVTLQGILWVFLLSITVSGRPLFDHAHSTLVQNALVQTVDEELSSLWDKLTKTAKVTFSEGQDDSEEM